MLHSCSSNIKITYSFTVQRGAMKDDDIISVICEILLNIRI